MGFVQDIVHGEKTLPALHRIGKPFRCQHGAGGEFCPAEGRVGDDDAVLGTDPAHRVFSGYFADPFAGDGKRTGGQQFAMGLGGILGTFRRKLPVTLELVLQNDVTDQGDRCFAGDI